MKLGDLEAYRYKGLKPEGFDQSLTMYVAPTTEGVATVACAAPAAKAGAFLPDCEGAATSLVLNTGDAYPLGADEDYLEALDYTIGKLNASRASGHAGPAPRTHRPRPGERREEPPDSYTAAARSLAGVEVSPAFVAANADLVEALGATASGYEQHGRVARAPAAAPATTAACGR